jgi:hypothetical protein
MNITKPKKTYVKPVVKERKIQNNDPCPCASGLKFKNCHGKENRLLLQNRVIEVRAKQREKSGKA